MQFHERLTNFLDASGVRFSIHHAGNPLLITDSPSWRWTDSVLVRVNLAFVDGRLSMLVCRADQQVDPTRTSVAFGWAEVGLAHPDKLQGAFPDIVDIRWMPPLGNFWRMPVFIDAALDGEVALRFHAGQPEIVIELSLADYYQLAHPTITTFATNDATGPDIAVGKGIADPSGSAAVVCQCRRSGLREASLRLAGVP